jgi:hypothetical protein
MFLRLLKRRAGNAYAAYGPSEVSFHDFSSFVADFLESKCAKKSKTESVSQVDTSRVSVPGLPDWYVCFRCEKMNQHWSKDCNVGKVSTDDLQLVTEVIVHLTSAQFIVLTHLRASLTTFRHYLTRRFIRDLSSAQPQGEQLAVRLSTAVVLWLAKNKIGMAELRRTSGSELLEVLKRSTMIFPKILSANAFVEITQEFLQSCG